MIEIDGSQGEGGGQIIRTAIGLSAVTGKSVRIYNIRAGRCNPGLQAQHLTGINACTELCSAEIKGNKKGCTEVIFIPGKIKAGKHKIDVDTAGAITLVLQTLVLPSIHADSEVKLEITGGTDVKWSPTTAFFESVFCGNMKKLGIEIESKIIKAGFFPKGGGKVLVKTKPCKDLKPVEWTEQGDIRHVDCRSFASKNLETADVAERQMKGFEQFFRKIGFRDVQYVISSSIGTSITAHVHCNTIIGASALGEVGKPAEKVGEECAELLKKQINSGTCLDEWMSDQILPYLALATGRVSVAEITKHCLTNIWVIEKFLPVKFEVHGKLGEKGVIEVKK